jgi:uncharacterized phage infection (PIP) family protein YhgE
MINEKDSAIYIVLGTFNEIENNLAAIKAKENIITATAQNVEDQRTREEKINEDINFIYAWMQDNQKKVAKLQEQLRCAHIENNDLKNTIKNLQTKLAEKNAEILELRKNLLNMNLKIDDLTYTLDTLTFDIQVKQAIIEAQDESLNSAFYLFGTEKELKEMQVLNKKGGFIGIGGSKKINEDFNKEYFTEIDIRKTTKFEFAKAKKIRIVTPHPTSSYKLYGAKPVDSLVIENHDDFWGVSKYLLIIIN